MRAVTSKTQTVVSIEGGKFLINGTPTHAGRFWNDKAIEGLLFNSRMANAMSDDENPQTKGIWAYLDGPFSAERNVSEFIAALPSYKAHGLDAVGINMQGGSPQGYSWVQPWTITGFEADGTPKTAWLDRLDRIVTACDELGMVVILGLFYWKQTRVFSDEAAVCNAVTKTVDWLAQRGARNVLIEIGNEVDLTFYQKNIEAARCHELIALAQAHSRGKFETPSGRLMVSTSLAFPKPVPDKIMEVADFLLIHGNGTHHPDSVRLQILRNKLSKAYRGQPIVSNEDDHYDFDKPDNNFFAAIGEGVSWGFFDYRMNREGYAEGFQSLPVDWSISTNRKKGFFNLLKNVTGA
jgi:hypothetical protein